MKYKLTRKFQKKDLEIIRKRQIAYHPAFFAATAIVCSTTCASACEIPWNRSPPSETPAPSIPSDPPLPRKVDFSENRSKIGLKPFKID